VSKARTRFSWFASVTAAVALAAQPLAPAVAAMAGTPQAATTTKAPPATAKPAATQAPAAATPPPADGGWPRLHEMKGGGDFLIYQPQVASWDNQKTMVAYSAVSYRAKPSDQPKLGTVKIEAETKVSVTERLVSFANMKVAEVNFQDLDKNLTREIVTQMEGAMPADERVIALERVLAAVDKSSIVPKNVEGVKAIPPPIFFSQTPAIMVNIDGEPIWSPIKEVDLKFAVNTNWDLFQHATAGYFLRNEKVWLKAADVKGPWTPAGDLPDSFKKLPDKDENWKDVKDSLPGKKIKATEAPTVFVSQTPAELILLTGAPAYKAVTGTRLMWVSNTESDVFRVGTSGRVYYLVAGRWFSAPDFKGPWEFSTLSLPDDFKKIPVEHDRSRVLASVPGTDQAIEAVMLAQIPQTARVNKKEIKAPEVAFQGDAQFQKIDTTTVERAVNTDKDVFKVNGLYYLCYNGVWFVGKAVNGPWEVAETVPQEIYKIPVSSPSHHVTYVTVEEDDDDDWVVFAAAAGYTGMMIAWGCTVWGSGWYYPPYYGYGGFYPYYYPHFPTYGYSAWYNPWTGAYGRSAGVYGPYGGAGVAARYNPRTGTYSRGAAAYGPYGSRSVAQAYNPRTGTYAQTRQGSNVYGSWGSTSVQRGDDWAKTNRYTNRQTGTTTRTVRTDDGAAVSKKGADGGRVAAGSDGNIYAGKDGSAYRRQDGTWQKYENGGWNDTANQPGGKDNPNDRTATGNRAGTTGSTTKPSTTTDRSTIDQLNRDSQARTTGSSRTTGQSTYRGGTGSSSAGTYRGGGGGGARAGGGRRGR
jgi:hypothetical protein